MNMVKKKTTKPEKQSRAKYQCPPNLEKIIERVNLVPLKIEMADLSDLLKSLQEKENPTVLKYIDDLLLEKTKAQFAECIAPLPKDFQDEIRWYPEEFIEQFSSSGQELSSSGRERLGMYLILNSYMLFYQLRRDVKNFAQNVERLRKSKKNEVQTISEWNTDPMTISAPVLKGEGGKEYLGGFAGLIGKFQSDRLRICKICTRVFWAKRAESEACSQDCANNLRVRRSRSLTDEEKAKRKAEREANRKLIKDRKAKTTKRSKNNGTL